MRQPLLALGLHALTASDLARGALSQAQDPRLRWRTVARLRLCILHLLDRLVLRLLARIVP